jgi:hypothetical protein
MARNRIQQEISIISKFCENSILKIQNFVQTLKIEIDQASKDMIANVQKICEDYKDSLQNDSGLIENLKLQGSAEMIQKFEIMKIIFENSLNTFLELFKTIEYVESEEDYDRFCKINKDNEKRKALSLFFVNLCNNQIISQEKIVTITCDLMKQVVKLIKENNKKNEVDEITENISILYSKSIFENCSSEVDQKIEDELFIDIVHRLSLCKVKTFPSLSNKSIFKYMDMIDM